MVVVVIVVVAVVMMAVVVVDVVVVDVDVVGDSVLSRNDTEGTIWTPLRLCSSNDFLQATKHRHQPRIGSADCYFDFIEQW